MHHRRPASLLSPMQFDDVVGRIVVELEGAVREFSEAHGYAFDRRDRPTDEQDKRVSSSSVSDITGSVVVEQGYARNALRRACKKLTHIEKEAMAIRDAIRQIFATPEDEWEQLASYRTPNQEETKVLTHARGQRDKRDVLEDIVRTQARLNRLRAEAGRLA